MPLWISSLLHTYASTPQRRHLLSSPITKPSPSGVELAQLGSDAQPLALRIPADGGGGGGARDGFADAPPARGGDVTSEPWFWILLGVVAVGAGVGIGFGVDAATRGPEPGTLGVVTLRM